LLSGRRRSAPKTPIRLAEALPLLERASRAVRKYPNLRFVRDPLLETYITLGQSEKAAALVKETLAEARAALPADSPQLAGVLANVGSSLLKTKSWAKAQLVLREAVTIRDSKDPDDWRTFNTRSMLGAALLGQMKYAEAEPLVIQGYEEMKAREAKIPATATRAACTKQVSEWSACTRPGASQRRPPDGRRGLAFPTCRPTSSRGHESAGLRLSDPDPQADG
jgi:uncharacterized protein HemY